MVDSINGTSSVPSVLFPHTAATSDTGDSGKTGEVKGEKLNNNATLSAPKTDSTESYESRDGNAAVENDKAVHQASEAAHNEPPGSRVDILA